MKNTLVLAGSIIVAGAFIGGGLYLSKTPVNTSAEKIPVPKEITVKAVDENDHTVGPANAAVTIIEYSDTECPFCKVFHSTLLSITADKEFSGKVRWVYRHFPLDSLHKKARTEAEALECAALLGGNDAFWEMTNNLYATTKSNDTLDLTLLPSMAEAAGISRTDFIECTTSGRTAARVESDYQSAVAAGGTGTPYSIIIGPKGQKIPLSGAVPLEALKVQLRSLL